MAFLLVVALVHLSSVALMLRHDHMGSGHLPRTAIFPILFLAMLNAIWKRLRGKPLLKSTELVIVYSVLVVLLLMFILDIFQAIVSPWIRDEIAQA